MRSLFEETKDIALLVKSHREPRRGRVNDLIVDLNEAMRSAISPRERFRDISSEELCFFLYNLGVIFKKTSTRTSVSSAIVSDILYELSFSKNINSKNISNTLYGVGLIAKAERLDGMLNFSSFRFLLNLLAKSCSKGQNIGSSLYGLGKIAKSGHLVGAIDIASFEAHLNLLARSKRDPQAISNTLYGLGELGKSGQLVGVIDIASFEAHLNLLARSKRDPQAISNTLYGLGELGKSGHLVGAIDIASFEAHLNLLARSETDPQAISNTLYGLGELGKSGHLVGAIDIASFEALLNFLARSQRDPQALSNTLYGLGELAKSGHLVGAIDIASFQRLLKIFDGGRGNAQAVSNTLYGLGEVSKSGQLVGAIDISSFEVLLELLVRSGPNAQSISNTLYGLGQLASVGSLSGEIDSEVLGLLFEKTDLEGFCDISLRQTLFGLSELRFSGAGLVNKLFELLLRRSYVHPVECITILELYTLLLRDNAVQEAYFERLLSHMSYELGQFSEAQQQRLQGILSSLDTEHRIRLDECLGVRAIEIFSNDSDVPLESVTIKNNAVAPAREGRVITYRSQASKASFPESYEFEKERSTIFNAIANEDLGALERLLGIRTPTPSHQQAKSKGSRFSFIDCERAGVARQEDVEIDNKRTGNRLVSHFLERTEPAALKYLIANSRHEYFERILRACGKHKQYQFAIRLVLHPILLHLPSVELRGMIADLLTLGFYRDHRATLSLIDALQLRRLSHSEESELVLELQEKLMSEAIGHHEQHHPHVTRRLLDYRLSLSTHFMEMVAFTEMMDDFPAPQVALVSVVDEMDVVQQAPVFVEDPLMHADGKVNPSAFYSSETVQKLLRLKLERMARADVALFASLDYAEAPETGVILTRLLEYLGNAEGVALTTMLFPICIYHHWVGLRLKVNDAERAIELTYYDSLPSEPYKDVVQAAAANAAKEVYAGFAVSFRVHCRYQQEDGSSCGAYLVENMMHDLLHSGISKKSSAMKFRAAHLEFLREYDHEYYDRHLQLAQANNELSQGVLALGRAPKRQAESVIHPERAHGYKKPTSVVSDSLFQRRGEKRSREIVLSINRP